MSDDAIRSLVRRMRVAVLATLLAFVALIAMPDYSGAAVLLVLLLVPRKNALAWARLLGVLVFIGTVLGFWTLVKTERHPSLLAITILLVIAAAQVMVVHAANRAWRQLLMECKESGTLLGATAFAAAYFCVLLGLWIYVAGDVNVNHVARNDAVSVGSIRKIRAAVESYRREHNMYPRQLSDLRNMIDNDLACDQPP